MTSERIIEVAMEYFSELGYAGTSFTLIAEAVGIRKQSIYAHFQSKEHLYLECFERAIHIERQRAQYYHGQIPTNLKAQELEELIYAYLLSNYAQKNVLFLYRAGLFAPQKYKLNNQAYVLKYRDIILEVFRPLILASLKGEEVSEQKLATVIESLFCVYDGCMVELILNGNTAFHRRFESIWPLFWGSIVQKIG